MKIQKFTREKKDGTPDGEVYAFWCPGCEEHHLFTTLRQEKPVWTFDPRMVSFSPSLLYPSKPTRCHLYLRNGKIEFLSDCGHALAGKTVDVPEIPPEFVWPGGETVL